MASVPYAWSRRQLILLSTMRIALVPLLLLCCAPRAAPVISGETPAFIFTAALGITNGLAGSLPMMFAPSKVPATLKEATGNMMTLSYNIGLTAGSLIGYVFDSMLGPPIANPCPTYPYAPMHSTPANNVTVATVRAITTTLRTVVTAATTTTTTPAPTIVPPMLMMNVTRPAPTTTPAALITTVATALLTTLAANLTNTTVASPTAAATTPTPLRLPIH